MRKLSFVLALVLALSCCLLASCGGDEDTSSAAATSSAASSSTEESSVAEESSVVEESSVAEASSAVEESSEVSAPSVEATEGVEPSGDNLALNATITGADVNESTAQYSASLNDGAYDTDLTGSWFGYLYNPSVPDQANAPDGLGTMLIDLGEVKEITAARLHTFVGNDWGIVAPASITFEFSEDGENFVKFGEKELEQAEAGVRAADWIGFTLSAPVNAQYVRVTVKLGATWGFINEVEVY